MKRRTSCDACNLRKTKCDLVELQAAHTLSGRITCSFCRSLNLTCRITGKSKEGQESNSRKLLRERLSTSSDAGAARRKCGKRIRSLLEKEDDIEGRETFVTEEEAASLHRESFHSNEPSSHSNARLLDVQGLTVAILFACVEAYFSTMGVWMEVSQSESVVRARIDALLRSVQGLEARDDEAVAQSSMGTELLVLAIAARGARCSSYSHLFEPLTDRFVRLVRQGDLLTQSGLDGVEAVTILHEGYFRPFNPISSEGSLPTCLALDPLGKGFPTELCLFLGYNHMSEVDIRRRAHIFWTVYVVDAIRSASACRMYRLQEEDIGWPFPTPPEVHASINIGVLARNICRALFSARAKHFGVQSNDVNALLDELISWPKRCAISLALFPSITSSHPEIAPRREMIARAVKLGMWLRLFLSVWTSIHGQQRTNLSAAVVQRVERETSGVVNEVIELAKICVHYNLVDCGSTLLVSTFAAWFLFLLQQTEHDHAPSAHHIISAISSARHTKGADALATTLERVSVQGIKDGRISVGDISRAAEAGRMPDTIARLSFQPLIGHRYDSDTSPRTADDRSPFPSEDEQRYGAASNPDTTSVAGSSTAAEPGALAWDPDLLTFLDAFMSQP